MEKRMYRGIGDVYILWHGEWADPELEYDGMTVNYWDVDQIVYGLFRDECRSHNVDPELGDFTGFCMNYADTIRQVIRDIWNQSNK